MSITKESILEQIDKQNELLQEAIVRNLGLKAILSGIFDAMHEKATTSKTEVEQMKYRNINILRRKDGRWYARVPIGHSQRKDIYGRTQLECYEKLKKFLATKPKPVIAINNIKTFGSWTSDWLRLYKEPTIRMSTLSRIKSNLNNWLLPYFAKMDITKITGLDIQEFLSTITAEYTKSHCWIIIKDH